jgi:hypothetical protein
MPSFLRRLMTHHPVLDQGPPANFRPVWHVGHLVFQEGIPRLKASSLTGGGFIPQKSLAGHEQPSWQALAIPRGSILGGGVLPSRPAFLTPLSGPSSTAQF